MKELNCYKFSDFSKTKAGMGQHRRGSCNGRNKDKGTSVPSPYSDMVQTMVPLKGKKIKLHVGLLMELRERITKSYGTNTGFPCR